MHGCGGSIAGAWSPILCEREEKSVLRFREKNSKHPTTTMKPPLDPSLKNKNHTSFSKELFFGRNVSFYVKKKGGKVLNTEGVVAQSHVHTRAHPSFQVPNPRSFTQLFYKAPSTPELPPTPFTCPHALIYLPRNILMCELATHKCKSVQHNSIGACNTPTY